MIYMYKFIPPLNVDDILGAKDLSSEMALFVSHKINFGSQPIRLTNDQSHVMFHGVHQTWNQGHGRSPQPP